MPMRNPVQEGYLILGDVSGYTAFLTGTEMDHAQEIMEDLINLILDHIQPPLKLVKLEGDAVFCCAPGSGFLDATHLLDQLEACYADFADHLVDMHRATSCTCAACRAIPTLDLKFFAHYGSFLIQRLAGVEDLAGTDVILAHRLLKNHITEETGLRGYMFVTDACLAKVGAPLPLARHSESYEHLGEVGGGVHDLRAAWRALCESRREYIGPDQADVGFERVLPAPPPVVWDYWMDPATRVQVIDDMSASENQPDADGRMREGTGYHCAHGAYTSQHQIRDWRPFGYYTELMNSVPAPGVPFAPPPMLITYEFLPAGPKQTRFVMHARLVDRDSPLLANTPMFQSMIDGLYQPCLQRLEQVLLADAGNYTLPEPDAPGAADSGA